MRRVVVTGIGAVTPLGTGVQRHFDGLRTAQSGIGPIQKFDARSFGSRIAGEVTDLDIDSVPLPEPLSTALRRDPKSIFGIVAAREALCDAFGNTPATEYYPPDHLATIMATGLEIFDCEDIIDHLKGDIVQGNSLFEQLKANPIFAKLQIPSDLGVRTIAAEAKAGGLYSVNVSACAAGTQAIGEAYRAIREGAAEAAITGGYDSMINPIAVGGFCKLEALSTSNDLGGGASRPFDRTRDGFVLGEGAAICILENLESAIARKARIHGEVFGYGTSADAYRVTDPAEDQAGAVAAIKGSLEDAGLEPKHVDYINAHGTATRKNDPAETRAIRSAFGSRAYEIPVSSTKSQIGHLIGAAGAVEFLSGLFALKEQIVPATINLAEPDPRCDLDFVPNTPRSAKVDVFMSNSFGFGGQNAVILAGKMHGFGGSREMRQRT